MIAAIEATTDGWGTFFRNGAVDTLWLGIAPISGLRTLHAKVERRLLGAGIPPDPRAYRPHVTLARFGRRAAPDVGMAERLPPCPQIALRFDEVRLYESLLGRDGARYVTVARYPLG